jgi:Amiloride-sensitive sodium channel
MQLGMPGDDGHLYKGTFGKPFTEIMYRESVTFIVEPKVMTTSFQLRDYPIAERQCNFSNERRLKYFPHYIQSNCELECEVNDVFENCGCFPIFIESKRKRLWNRTLISTIVFRPWSC